MGAAAPMLAKPDTPKAGVAAVPPDAHGDGLLPRAEACPNAAGAR